MRLLPIVLLLLPQIFISPKTSATAITGGTCTNQAVTALDTAGNPTCTTLTSAYTTGLATLTGSEVLTNKTLTAPIISQVPVAVGSLPTCNSANNNRIAIVNDALTPALGIAVSAGGLLTVGVICISGTGWIVF